ncbi:hypothetical protein BJV77DRAFT_475236 [Russula vinacea]|nr:hypothetical protein BJV77DRAFT_475236 [Russula vinacea]
MYTVHVRPADFYIIRQFFFSHSWGAFRENMDARLWTLGTAATACYNPYARVRTFHFRCSPHLCRPSPLSNEHCLLHLISQSFTINQSPTHPPHSIPYSLLYFYPHLGLSHRLCCFHNFFLCLYCLVVRPAPLLSSWEQPFSTLLHDFAPLPSRFSGNFSHNSPSHSRLYPSANVKRKEIRSRAAAASGPRSGAVDTDHV